MLTIIQGIQFYPFLIIFQLFGMLAYLLVVVLGITSLPSVGRALSWREFRFVQSKLGWLALILATLHCGVEGWDKLFQFWCGFPSTNQLPMYVPVFTIATKIPLVLFDFTSPR